MAFRVGLATDDAERAQRLGFDFVELPYALSIRRDTPHELVRVDAPPSLVAATLHESSRYGLTQPLVVPLAGEWTLVALARLVEVAARAGRSVLAANAGQGPREWAEAMRALPPEVGFCFDAGAASRNAPPAVDEPALAYLRWADRVGVLRLHDVSGERSHLPLGEGDLRLPTLAAALRDAGVEVPIVLDVDGEDAALAQSLALARDLFSASS